MAKFHFEDPDLKNSMLEIGFPSFADERDNFIDSKRNQIRTENKESFKPKFRSKGHICLSVVITVLVAKGPYCFSLSFPLF